MKTKLLCIVCCVILMACGEHEQAGAPQFPVPTALQSSVNQFQPEGKSSLLKIKGLYIGMDILKVPSSMMDILAEQQLSGFSFTDAMPAGEGGQCVLMYTKPFLHAIEARMHERYGSARAQAKVDEEILTSCVNSDGVLMVKSDAAGKVVRIEFNDVKDIFNTAGQSPGDFVKKLTSDYHVPEMKLNEAKNSWSYVGPDGTRVAVDAKEVLGIPMLRLYISKETL